MAVPSDHHAFGFCFQPASVLSLHQRGGVGCDGCRFNFGGSVGSDNCPFRPLVSFLGMGARCGGRGWSSHPARDLLAGILLAGGGVGVYVASALTEAPSLPSFSPFSVGGLGGGGVAGGIDPGADDAWTPSGDHHAIGELWHFPLLKDVKRYFEYLPRMHQLGWWVILLEHHMPCRVTLHEALLSGVSGGLFHLCHRARCDLSTGCLWRHSWMPHVWLRRCGQWLLALGRAATR